MAKYQPVAKTKYTTQTIQNFGFDEAYKTPIRLIYGFDATGAVRPAKVNANGELVVNDSGLDKALILDSITTANVTYIGKAAPATVTSASTWQIMKMDKTVGDVITITWADGDTDYDNEWDNRDSLSYV